MTQSAEPLNRMLVDSHCHLDFADFDADREALMQRARDAGVGLMVTISTRVRQFDKIRALAEAHDEVYCSVGTHPNSAHEEPDITCFRLGSSMSIASVVVSPWPEMAPRQSSMSLRAAHCPGRFSARRRKDW